MVSHIGVGIIFRAKCFNLAVFKFSSFVQFQFNKLKMK